MHTLPQTEPAVALKKQRVTLILFFAAFVLPVVIAYVLLVNGWWQKTGSVNNGQLITPPLTLSPQLHQQLTQNVSGKTPWIVLGMLGQHCGDSCQNALLLARQTSLLLGAESQRVQMVFSHTAALNNQQKQHLKESFSRLTIQKTEASLLEPLFNRLPEIKPVSGQLTHLMIIDPLGNAMLLHPVANDSETAIKQGKGFVKDLKRLLKLSRIG